jgi:hypothetical protein
VRMLVHFKSLLPVKNYGKIADIEHERPVRFVTERYLTN